MHYRLLFQFIALLIAVQHFAVDAEIDLSDFVAPTAASPFQSRPGKQRAIILPYSLYQRRLEEQSRLRNQSKPKLTSTATNQQYSGGLLEDKLVSIYLPSFKDANQSQIAEEADALQSRKAMLETLGGYNEATNDGEITTNSNNSQERSTYSTSKTRQPLPYHRSIFRPRTNQILTVNEPRYQPTQGPVKYNPKPMSEKLFEAPIPERPPFANSPSLRKNIFVNGIPLDESSPGALNTQLLSSGSSSSALIDQSYQPRPVYSNLYPAPFNTLSSDPSSQNLIESIFSQSQTPVRLAPGNVQPGLVGGGSQALNPLQALSNTANSLGGPEMLNQLLGGGGSPLEQIAKLARNLLNLQSGHPELLSTLTKALAANTAAEGSKLTSNAVIQPASTAGANILDKVLLPAASSSEILFSNAKDEDSSNATMKLLNNLPEDQRSLLAAAIQNGEIDGSNLTPTLANLIKEKSLLKSDSRLLEWIQQNRPRGPEKENDRITIGDKLPYYGRYCGAFVEQSNFNKTYNIDGALWAVDDHRLIVSKFHFKPGSRTENITFWAGPAKETKTSNDVFPSDNGFYLEPKPIDLTIFMNQQVKVVKAKIRPLTQKDAPVVAAEIEEKLEEEYEKNSTSNELKRLKRDMSTVPLHFEASPSNETDGSVHLTVTSPHTETTTASSIDEDHSHILVSATNSEVTIGKEALEEKSPATTSHSLTPLDWYAGFQPLLLTLPEDRSVRSLHWVSVYNHGKKESPAFVLIPNGVAFQIPAAVQLRPLTPNGSYRVSSGAIKALDTKTIELEDFSLETNGLAVWFLVGKEIVPHAEGHIVPVFDKTTKEFDCDSLRDYKNETVTLRLPDTMDIKDVFWFSVFSITKSVSLSHLYLPYNDLHVPPDLLAISTPRCVWNSNPEKH